MKNKLFFSLAAIAILCVAWFAVQAKLQKTNTLRQQWEYKTIQVYGPNGNWQTWWEDGKELPKPVNGARRAELGNEGWELIAVVPLMSETYNMTGGNQGTTGLIQYFKRPK